MSATPYKIHHDGKKIPFDAVDTSPIPCDFKINEQVVFTNDNGVKFNMRIRGFLAAQDIPEEDDPRFIYVCTQAWWFPTRASSLKKVELHPNQGVF